MVSTRQMSTAGSTSSSLSQSSSNCNDESVPSSPPPPLPTITTRLSVITRQSSALATTSAAAILAVPSTSRSSTNSPILPSSSSSSSSSLSKGIISGTNNDQANTQKISLLDLPFEILDKIFSYVGYKKVSQMRVCSKQMNQICSSVLNSTFTKLQFQLHHRFQTVKSMMPRRESARRNHPLACECDIIETCHMRLSLLQMTFGKHIERKHCCFFPGAILDEVYCVLNYIRTTPKLERPYKVTDELFDLSTMAMEYFKEHIEPNLPEIMYFKNSFFPSKNKQSFSMKTVSELTNTSTEPPQSNMVLRKGIRKIKQGMKMYNNQLTALRSELRTCKRKSSEQGKQIAEQQKLLAEQQKQTLEYANRLDENDRKNEEMSRKFSTLLQELNKCKTELQYWRSKSPAVQVCSSCGHRMTPTVTPDEYQALINQGVKPQDINIHLDDVDDSDTSSNILSELGLDNQSTSEFVFPDEATTAKLLAISSANSASTTTVANLFDNESIIAVPVAHTGSYMHSNVTVAASNITDSATVEDFIPETTTSDNIMSTTSSSPLISTGSKRRCNGGAVKSSAPTSTVTSIIGLNTKEKSSCANTKKKHQQQQQQQQQQDEELQQQQQPLNYAAGSDGGNYYNFDEGSEQLANNISILSSTQTASGLINNEDGGSGGDNLSIIDPSCSSVTLINNSLNSNDTKKARKVQNKGSRCHNSNNKRNK